MRDKNMWQGFKIPTSAKGSPIKRLVLRGWTLDDELPAVEYEDGSFGVCIGDSSFKPSPPYERD